MARVQQRVGGSLTVWLILFVALWLTSTVLLVILYTSQEGLRSENARLLSDNQRLISPTERNALALFQSARKGGPTVVGLLEGARAETAQLATGDEADDPAAVRTKLDELLGTIRSDAIVPDPESYADSSYRQALDMLYKAFSAEHAGRIDAIERVTALEAEVDRLTQASAREKNNLDKRATEMRDQLADVEADRARYRKERDEQVAGLGRKFDDYRKQNDADLTEERQRSAVLNRQVGRLRERALALQEKLGGMMIGPQKLSTARQPDGHILRAVPGDEVVYIDLGRKQRVVLGLRFAVYSAESGIPADGRAKAQIEVVSVYEHAAQCRIVCVVPDEVILEGDLVANPVFDPDREVVFVVVGRFDLDHDGIADADGAAAIESMITEWGGTLSAKLTALTDFVVLGGPPRRPKSVGGGSAEQTAQLRAMQRMYDRYAETAASAVTLAVPILTQEVFLNFLGYTRH